MIEVIGLCGAARLAEGHEQLSIGTELVNLIPLRCSGTRSNRSSAARGGCFASCGLWRIVLAIRDPDVAIAIDEDAMREDEHAFSKTLHQFSRRHLAGRAIEAAVLAAAFRDPYGLAVLVDFNRAG